MVFKNNSIFWKFRVHFVFFTFPLLLFEIIRPLNPLYQFCIQFITLLVYLAYNGPAHLNFIFLNYRCIFKFVILLPKTFYFIFLCTFDILYTIFNLLFLISFYTGILYCSCVKFRRQKYSHRIKGCCVAQLDKLISNVWKIKLKHS